MGCTKNKERDSDILEKKMYKKEKGALICYRVDYFGQKLNAIRSSILGGGSILKRHQ